MSYIIAVGPKEALSSLIQSLLKALVHSNLPLRRSLIANDVLSFCSLKNFYQIWDDMLNKQKQHKYWKEQRIYLL